MKRLIVTADDFGLSPGVVTGIVEAHERGIVTATSLMVNAPAFEAASAWAHQHETMAVGLHFVLTFGAPLGPLAPLENLVDAEGRFLRLETKAHEGATADEVRAELRAQLERFEAAVGRRPSHIDGHHHVHVLGGILDAVLEQAARLDVPVRSIDRESRERIRGAGVATADRFIDRFYGEGNVGEDSLLTILDALPEGTSELMCHPARVDTKLERLSSYVEPREVELRTLSSARVRRALEKAGITLAHGPRI